MANAAPAVKSAPNPAAIPLVLPKAHRNYPRMLVTESLPNAQGLPRTDATAAAVKEPKQDEATAAAEAMTLCHGLTCAAPSIYERQTR